MRSSPAEGGRFVKQTQITRFESNSSFEQTQITRFEVVLGAGVAVVGGC